MFSKVIRKSVLVSGLSRSYGKNVCKLQKNLQADLNLGSSCNKKYINTYCLLYYSQRNLEKKIDDSENKRLEEDDTEIQQKKNIPEQKAEVKVKESTKKSDDISEEKDEKGEILFDPDILEEEQRKERKQDRQWRRYGREVILHSFEKAENKNKDSYLECLRMYTNAPGKKLERVLFIYTALKYMEEFGVHKELEVYKAIINIFPKESMIPTNVFQTWFMHYPKEQYCAVAILEQMEDNAVIPDPEMETMLLNVFGSHGLPLQKYWKMMYWMPKFKHKNPWPVPNPIPDDAFELAKLAMIKISSVDFKSTITIFDTKDVEDSIDKTWIVSAMAPKQSELLIKHDKKTAVYVEGPFKIYVATKSVDYYTLRADVPEGKTFPEFDLDAVDKIRNPYLETKSSVIEAPSVHEQTDGTIFANCATGTSTKDSLLSWIRCLQKQNPVLGEIPVVFTLRNYSRDDLFLGESKEDKEKEAPADNDDETKLLHR